MPPERRLTAVVPYDLPNPRFEARVAVAVTARNRGLEVGELIEEKVRAHAGKLWRVYTYRARRDPVVARFFDGRNG